MDTAQTGSAVGGSVSMRTCCRSSAEPGLQDKQIKMNGVHSEHECQTKRKLNQFGDYEETLHMTQKDWELRWAKGQTQFHVPIIHPMLRKHINLLTNNKKCRIMLPMCGKSLDMKWLLDEGHDVVGNEYVAQGCRDFFEENHIDYVTESIPDIDGVIYKAADGRPISVYCCDFFKLTPAVIGTFDCIWDRGSYAAINWEMRKRYGQMLPCFMTSSTQLLIDAFRVDNDIFGGPPFNSEEQEIHDNFGHSCNVEKVDERNAMTPWQREWGVNSFIEDLYLITKKT